MGIDAINNDVMLHCATPMCDVFEHEAAMMRCLQMTKAYLQMHAIVCNLTCRPMRALPCRMYYAAHAVHVIHMQYTHACSGVRPMSGMSGTARVASQRGSEVKSEVDTRPACACMHASAHGLQPHEHACRHV